MRKAGLQRRNIPRHRRRGFTLVELLVVIAIIGLLIGILVPALLPAKLSTMRAACMSNLKQIGIGYEMYRDDHRRQLPDVQTLPVDPQRPGLDDALEPYLGQSKFWKCPADGEVYAQVGVSYEYFIGFYLQMISLDDTDPQSKRNELLRFLEQNTSLAYILFDAEDWHVGGPGGAARNCLFLDGHVDWFVVGQP